MAKIASYFEGIDDCSMSNHLYHEAGVESNPLVHVEHIEDQKIASLVESLHALLDDSNVQDISDMSVYPLGTDIGPIFDQNTPADFDIRDKEFCLKTHVSFHNIVE